MKVRWEYDAIFTAVASIPAGRVATYGQIAELADLPRRWRLVGRALRSLPPDSAVPWQRVVNARGAISDRGAGDEACEQRILLEEEGILFDGRGIIDLERYRWNP